MRRASLAALVLLSARAAIACSCLGPGTAEQELARADAVFAGVVEAIDDPGAERRQHMSDAERYRLGRNIPNDWGPDFGIRIRVRVLQWWKNDATAASVEVWTGYVGGGCGYGFEKGLSYLVYAHRATSGRLTTSMCDRTGILVCALRDIPRFGAPLKSYETFTFASLAAREEPYKASLRTCITPAVLVSERGFTMNKSCRFGANAIVDRNGVLSKFEITSLPVAAAKDVCPATLSAQITQHAQQWRFRPATIDGKAVAVKLNAISMLEPMTESEYRRFIDAMKRPRKRR